MKLHRVSHAGVGLEVHTYTLNVAPHPHAPGGDGATGVELIWRCAVGLHIELVRFQVYEDNRGRIRLITTAGAGGGEREEGGEGEEYENDKGGGLPHPRPPPLFFSFRSSSSMATPDHSQKARAARKREKKYIWSMGRVSMGGRCSISVA